LFSSDYEISAIVAGRNKQRGVANRTLVRQFRRFGDGSWARHFVAVQKTNPAVTMLVDQKKNAKYFRTSEKSWTMKLSQN
jgi:hypothetical protein